MVKKAEPQVTKKRITMKSVAYNDAGIMMEFEAVDYVRPDHLDAALTYANRVDDKGNRVWQSVTVSDEPDAGPAGYHGQTHVPDVWDHADAGTTFAATEA